MPLKMNVLWQFSWLRKSVWEGRDLSVAEHRELTNTLLNVFFFFLTDSSLQNQLHNNQGPVKNENPWLLVQKLSRELSMGPPKHRALCDYAKFILPLFALPKPLSLSIWNLVSL
jgi:hypothetical protein